MNFSLVFFALGVQHFCIATLLFTWLSLELHTANFKDDQECKEMDAPLKMLAKMNS